MSRLLTIINTNSYVGRFDHRWGSKDSIFYRYNLTTDSELSPSGLPTGVPGYGLLRLDWFTATGLDWVHTFSPTLINEAKVDYNRWQYGWTAQDQGDLVSKQLGILGAPTAYRDTGSPNLSFFPYDGMGAFESAPQAGAVNTFEYADTLTQIHGNHSLAYVYDVPFVRTLWKSSNRAVNYVVRDWEVTGIAMVQSGAPFTPTVDGNPSHNVDGNDRANIVSGVSFYPAHQTVQQWLNPAAFSTPAQYTYGNAGRDILNGPGEAAWDFSLIRKFPLGETWKLEFRAEMFNILNTPNFTLPNGDASSPSFGVIGNTVQPIAGQASGGPGDPRQIQFALRLTW